MQMFEYLPVLQFVKHAATVGQGVNVIAAPDNDTVRTVNIQTSASYFWGE
jgi:hypothetical protein